MPSLKILREPEVYRRTGLSKATRRRLEKLGDFPTRVPLGANSTGWFEHQIDEWLAKRAERVTTPPAKAPVRRARGRFQRRGEEERP
jgi:prophage regulatory protein